MALVYALFGAVWILFSDLALERIASAQTIETLYLQTIKGWIFIVVTAALVYVLIRRTVTAFRETEAARMESEQQLALLVERARDYAIFTLDDAGNVTSWNRGAQQILDWREEEILGRPLKVFYRERDVAANVPEQELARARMEGWIETEAMRVRQDATEFWAHVHLSALGPGEESSSGFLVVLRDVTERRRAQEALQQVNQTLATVIENSPLAIVTLDPSGKVISWNEAAEHLFGWKSVEVVGKRLPAVPEDRLKFFDENNAALAKGKQIEAMELVGVRADGGSVEVALWAAPLRDLRGNIVGNVRVYADIRERKRWETELKRFNEMLERRVTERTAMLEEANDELQAFSFTVSHDLRLPLRSLQTMARDLLTTQEQALDEEGKSQALRIVGAAARMERQVEDLLEYSRLSRHELKLERVSLVLVVYELMGRLERDPTYGKARFVVREPLGWVRAHPLTLQYAILNLLTHAMTSAGPAAHARIHVHARERGGHVRLFIENEAAAPSLPTRQQPAGNGTTDLTSGLALARHAIERLGGTAGVAQSDRGGDCFWIELPKADEHSVV